MLGGLRGNSGTGKACSGRPVRPGGEGRTQISEVLKLEGFFGRLLARLARPRGVLRPPRCARCWRPPMLGEAALRSSAAGAF